MLRSRPRRTRPAARLLAAAALVILAGLAFLPGATAHTVIWSGTLNVQTFDARLGCVEGETGKECSSSTVLSDDDFTFTGNSTTYSIVAVVLNTSDELLVRFSPQLPDALRNLILRVDGEAFYFETGNDIHTSTTSRYTWFKSGLSRSAGDSVMLRLETPPPNTPPRASSGRISTTAGGTYTFKASDFNFRDTDPPDELERVRITELPRAGRGWLEYDGNRIYYPRNVTKADLDANKLTYTSPESAHGVGHAAYDRFRFKVNDGEADSVWSYIMWIDVAGTPWWERGRACNDTSSSGLISTATHYRVFRDQIQVGRVGQSSEYGFKKNDTGAMINAASFRNKSEFPRPAGEYDDILAATYEITGLTVDNGTVSLKIKLGVGLEDRFILLLRVCGHTLALRDAIESDLVGGERTYTWSGTGLDWSRLTYPTDPDRGTVVVSLGVRIGARPTSAIVNGRTMTVRFDQALADNTMIAPDAFSVRVPPVYGQVSPVPSYTRTRTVTEVAVDGNVLTLTLNAPPPQFTGNYKPGLRLKYTPPTANALVGGDGHGVRAFAHLRVADETPDGLGALNPDAPRVTAASVNGRILEVTFDRDLGINTAIATTAFSVSVGPVSSSIDPVPAHTATRRVTAVETDGTTLRLTLNWPPPQFEGNHKPGLLLGYDPPSRNPLLGTNGAGVSAFSNLAVTDNTPDGEGVLDASSPAIIRATVNGTFLTLRFDQQIKLNRMLPTTAFTVRVGPVSSSIDPVPEYTETRTVTSVFAVDVVVELDLNAAPPQFEGNHKPGLLVSYTPPATNPLVSRFGNHRVPAFTDVAVTDLTADGSGTLVVMEQRVVSTPTVTDALELSASPRTEGTWTSGDTVEATLTFSEAVVVDTTGGTPSVTLKLGGTEEKTAGYLRGSGTTKLVFGYTLTGDDGTHLSMVLEGDSLTLNGGTIRSQANGVDAVLGHNGKSVVSPPLQLGTTPPPVILEDNEPDGTAVFENAPASHDGSSAFTVALRFSEDSQGISSFRTVRDSLLDVTNATILGARRLDGNLRWELRVRPDAQDDVTLTLPVRPCGAANAVCVDGAPLGAAVTATIPYAAPQAVQTPLTAEFVGMPARHDGGAFTFELAMSEDVSLGYKTVRDSALAVTGGTVAGARRLVQGSSRRWEVRVNPGGLGNVTVALAATTNCSANGAICTSDGRMQSSSASATVAGPALSVADASVDENSGAELAFAVTLGHAAARSVSVDYATSDGTATAGSDYTATSGTLTFTPGETSRTVRVAVLDDAHDEGAETMTLTLSNPSPSSVALADASATGTIENDDAMPQAWLARFGRTVAEQVLDAVESRMRADRTPGAVVSLAGERIGWRPDGDGMGAGHGDPVLAAGPEEEGSLADWLTGASDSGAGHTRTLTERELLLGSSFSLAAEAGGPGSGKVAVWGRGAVSRFDGREGDLTLDGEVASAMLGADWSGGPATVGLIVGHSTGEGSYRATPGGGTVSSTLTGIYPWGRYALSERVELWGAAGYGEGTLTLTPDKQDAMRADLDLWMATAGLRGVLVDGGEDGFTLAAKTDAMTVTTSSARVPGDLAASEGAVTRLRLGLEGAQPTRLADGSVLTPSMEIGVRHDGGDAETGFGADIGGGLAWRDAGRGLAAELRGRGLLTHESKGFRDRGLSGSLNWEPVEGGRGPRMSLVQTFGGPSTGGADALLGRGTLAGLAANDNGDLEQRRLEARFGWGFAAFGGRFTWTPEAAVGLSNAGREYSLGWRLGLAPRIGSMALDLHLEATRREAANDNAQHGIGFRMTARW